MTPVGVRFKTAGRIYYFDADGVSNLSAGDRVIVETDLDVVKCVHHRPEAEQRNAPAH